MHVAQPERDVREQIHRRAAEQSDRRDEPERILDTGDRALHPDGDQGDARDHRQMQI
jgi:hypothetical protein